MWATSRLNEIIRIMWGENRPYLLCNKTAQRKHPDHGRKIDPTFLAKYKLSSLQQAGPTKWSKLCGGKIDHTFHARYKLSSLKRKWSGSCGKNRLHLPSLDRFSASLRKWGGNTNTLRAPNWTSKPLFAEYSHYDYHVGHRFGLCNTKTLCFWWETGFTPKTHSEITSWVSSSHLGHFSISGFLIYVVWICHLLVSYFFTTALCNLSGWLEMTIQVKMQYFKSLFVPASLYHAKIYVSRPKMDVLI